ncbi:MAG: LPS export ABC transporter periplasmic protein LptC [Gemmatimonadales bacterium]|nr:LPS export ABC transporter periplasmic protein LptC [Gemmatimonadales bacterium]
MRILFGLSAVVLTCCGASGCGPNDEPSPVQVAQVQEVPEQQFFDYTFTETSAGVVQWILESDEMKKFTGQRDAQFTVVKMDFFNDGVHFSTLTADSGSANMLVKDVHVWGNVLLLKDNGDRLETEELFFDNKEQLIHNDIFNRTVTNQEVVTGYGLEATPDLEYIRIKDRAKGYATENVADESELN